MDPDQPAADPDDSTALRTPDAIDSARPPEAPPAEPVLLEPPMRRLWPAVTVLYSVLFALLLGMQFAVIGLTDRASLLESPVRFLNRVAARNLDLEEGAALRADWERALDRVQGYEPGDILAQTITAYESLGPDYEDLGPQRTLAVLLAEAGRWDEFQEALDTLEWFESEEEYTAIVQYAYGSEGSEEPVGIDETVSRLEPAWARDKLAWRIARRQGDESAAQEAESRLMQRAVALHAQVEPLIWSPIIIVALGVLALLVWAVLGLPLLRHGDGLTEAPWSVGRGYAVMVRAAVGGMVVSEAIAMLADSFAGLAFLRGFTSLVAIVPLLWLGSRHLLRPWGLNIISGFGLNVSPGDFGRMALFTAILAAVDLIGLIAISSVLDRFEIRMHWAESPLESFLWEPGWQVALDFFDGVVWAPIFEEIGCRGFLYVTVRRRLAPLPAALLTGLIFGSVHLYSLPGFLVVSWSGLVWSLAYERARSLVPGMISHSVGNIMAFGGMVLVYRW